MKEIEIKSLFRVYDMDELSQSDRELVSAAMEATKGSYAPYSKFRVGAAARLANGLVFTGANQENAAYPSGLCAERTTLFAANAQYPDQPVLALAIAARKGNRFMPTPISPCGACRQVISGVEDRFGHPVRILLYGTEGIYECNGIDALLPLRFVDSDMHI
ncbi:MAG: cytidine deaminase [Paraprevotella sp.]|nr:cytidine deaminase [Paraprevotella sp.]MDY2716935.1 cytidine deaminase [Bacteroidaceae bacterium]MDD6607455.1 cytidine deaminase [Paraprevotella sp.]MDD6758768.1 cytidine deaminase [Paraprevotella sp.]MDD6821089.1 cytidine deaminase [Paraprevotella sp.]